MALHPNFSITDPTAIQIMKVDSKKIQNTDNEKKPFNITWDDSDLKNKPDEPEKKKLSFFDILDIVNPLQHIPVVNSIYRRLTGDEMHPVSRLAGSALFGGPIGAVMGSVDALFAQENGQYFGDRVLSRLVDNNSKSVTPDRVVVTKVAQNTTINEQNAFEIKGKHLENDDNQFLKDMATPLETSERLSKIALARENYLKTQGRNFNKGAYLSQIY